VRRPRGCHLPPLSKTRPRSGDVYRTVRSAILDGDLPAGTRLPSSRQAAADYGVSRGLVEDVFGRLCEEGLLARAVGRGTFVAAAASQLAAPPTDGPESSARLRPSRRGRVLSADAMCREPEALAPFNAGVADAAAFPWLTWQRLQHRAIRELHRQALGFADPRGCARLREALSRHLAQFRGIRCEPNQVLIFNSSQQALAAVALLLLERNDGVWVEDPGYPGARAVFSIAGADLHPVPVDEGGMRVEFAIARWPRGRLAYVTPAHQYPSGAVLSLHRRLALLEWAARRRAWVVEDDYDGEFRHDGEPLMPLRSIDPHSRVIFLGTLSKSMFVALRLAYAVVPAALVEPLANIRTQLDGFTPPVPQIAMSFFMDDGYFATHLRHMRAIYRDKCAALAGGLKPLERHGWRCRGSRAGMHLVVEHPDADYARRVARDSGLDVRTLGSYRAARARGDGLVLRYGGLSIDEIERGCRQLVGAAQTVSQNGVGELGLRRR
jgi:GntR family transcriptional regulator/MocR family aminotransferase